MRGTEVADIERRANSRSFAIALPQVAIALAYVVAIGLVLAPLFTANIPALVDYPNHLVRMHVLTQISTNDALAEVYRVRWSAVPNLAMDAIVPPLVALVGLFNAGKVFLGMILILTVIGTAILHRSLYGRIGLWPLAVLPFVYNYVLALGFLNFLFGIALVPFALAGWLKTKHWPLPHRLGVFALVTTVLYLSHIAAVAVYGLAIAAIEFHRCWKGRAGRASDLARVLAAALGQFAVPVVLFSLVNPGFEGGGIVEFDWRNKISILFSPTAFYGSPIDLQIFLGAAGVLLVAILFRALSMAPRSR